MERQPVSEIKNNKSVKLLKEKGSTRVKSKLLSLLGAGAISIGNLIHPEATQAQEQNHPFNNRSREVLVVCAEENQPVIFYSRSLWEVSVNGREFNNGGNFAVVVGNKKTGQSYLAMAGSDNVDSIFGVTGFISESLIARGEIVTEDSAKASFTPGIYRYWHPNIPNLQSYTLEEHRENLIEQCYTETRTPQYPLQRIN